MALFSLQKMLFFLGFFLLFGCSASTDVVSDSWIQKRKYRPGFFIGAKSASSVITSETKQLTAMHRMPAPNHTQLMASKELGGEVEPVRNSSQIAPEVIVATVPGHPERSFDARSLNDVKSPVVEDEEEAEKSKSAGGLILAFILGMLTMLFLAIMTFSIDFNISIPLFG